MYIRLGSLAAAHPAERLAAEALPALRIMSCWHWRCSLPAAPSVAVGSRAAKCRRCRKVVTRCLDCAVSCSGAGVTVCRCCGLQGRSATCSKTRLHACQVVDCRRILKWTYAYGYYRFGEQAVSGMAVPRDVLRQRQEFFEFNQVRVRSCWKVSKVLAKRRRAVALCVESRVPGNDCTSLYIRSFRGDAEVAIAHSSLAHR